MMFGFGTIMMLLIIGIPVLLIVLIVAGWLGFRSNNPQATTNTGIVQAASIRKNCSHCGSGRQVEWTHYPQCGAAVNEI